jgi:tRNA1(Val) A37 N6-methylase TrmN6
MNAETQKLTGSFYTESKIAETMVNWAVRNKNDSILEPSFGDGIFVDKSINRLISLGNNVPAITAVEIQKEVADQFKNLNESLQIITNDFLTLDYKDCFDVVIGNPPYISISKLSSEQKISARSIINEHSVRCPDNGSIWFPFVLNAVKALKPDGRMAFVLPYEITYTRYSYGLWDVLSNNFSNISICRIYEDFFPDVDVETVLLLAEGKGKETTKADYKIYRTVDDFFNGRIDRHKLISIESIKQGERPFVNTMLSSHQQKLIEHLQSDRTLIKLSEFCKFKIGYVSADKMFFHPKPDIIEKYSIPTENLFPAIVNAKDINAGTGVGIEINKGDCSSNLYLPGYISDGDLEYIKNGEKDGIHEHYKCRLRNPWYITPCVDTPDVILSVFGEYPKLVINKGNYVASNSLLCGTIKNILPEQLICRWYNSLTLLSLERTVHSLGGGSFVIITGEADHLEIVACIPDEKIPEIYRALDKEIKLNGIESAYTLGDQLVLKNIFKLSDIDIAIIRSSIQELRNWRNPHKRRNLVFTAPHTLPYEKMIG